MRCDNCKKKMMFGYDCKCKKNFCLNCLSSFKHNCSYNYKEEKKKYLEETNIKIKKLKVEFI